MASSPFNTPQRIICIHCQYERAINDGIEVCPECGKQGLVHQHHFAPRMRRLRRWVWGAVFMAVLMLGSLLTMIIPGPIRILAGLFPILLLLATLQGFIGIFIAGSTYDRKGLHKNSSLRKHTWIGMTLSILMLCSIPITIGIVVLFAVIFG